MTADAAHEPCPWCLSIDRLAPPWRGDLGVRCNNPWHTQAVADAAHVAAVAEALCNAGCDSPTRGCDTEAETLSRHGHRAAVAVETLTPLIRAQVGDALAAENARLRAQVETLRHGVNHPYGGIDGCARCAPTTTTTED